MTTKVVKGSIWTLAGQIAPLAVSFVTTPFVIRMLGTEGYGVFILVVLIPTYLGFADFGMSLASTKFASEAYAKGDNVKEARIVRTAALIAVATSTPFAVMLFVFSESITRAMNVPENLVSDASTALKIGSITLVIGFINGILNTPQLTRLRMELGTLVNGGFRILGLLAIPIVLSVGGGIVGAVAVLMSVSLLTLFGHIYVSRRLLNNLIGLTLEKDSIRYLLKFGGDLSILGIAAFILVNAEKGLLAFSVSAAALAHYSIAFTLANMVVLFSSAMIQSLIPAFSQLQGSENAASLKTLFSRGVRLSLIWAFPLIVILSLVAKPFFTTWAGEEFGSESTYPFYLLLPGIIFNVVSYLPFAAILASGRSNVLARLYWIEIVPYCLIIWLLATTLGAKGAAIAWSLKMTVDTVVMFIITKEFCDIASLRRFLPWFLMATSCVALPFALNLFFESLNSAVIVISVLCLMAYTLLVWNRVLESDETIWLKQKMSIFFAR